MKNWDGTIEEFLSDTTIAVISYDPEGPSEIEMETPDGEAFYDLPSLYVHLENLFGPIKEANNNILASRINALLSEINPQNEAINKIWRDVKFNINEDVFVVRGDTNLELKELKISHVSIDISTKGVDVSYLDKDKIFAYKSSEVYGTYAEAKEAMLKKMEAIETKKVAE